MRACGVGLVTTEGLARCARASGHYGMHSESTGVYQWTDDSPGILPPPDAGDALRARIWAMREILSQRSLSRRLVSLPGWHWSPGILTQRGRLVDGLDGPVYPPDGVGGSWPPGPDDLPDLTDPATGGILLEMLGSTIASDIDVTTYYHDQGRDRRVLLRILGTGAHYGATLAEACAHALVALGRCAASDVPPGRQAWAVEHAKRQELSNWIDRLAVRVGCKDWALLPEIDRAIDDLLSEAGRLRGGER